MFSQIRKHCIETSKHDFVSVVMKKDDFANAKRLKTNNFLEFSRYRKSNAKFFISNLSSKKNKSIDTLMKKM